MARARPSAALRAAPVRIAGAAAGALLATGAFVLAGFPYDLLAARISRFAARATPLELRIGELGPSFSPLGPAAVATDVRVAGPRGAGIAVDRLWIRPAWSFGWLLLRPAFRIEVELAGGSIEGTLAGGPSFAGRISELDLAQLPIAVLWPGAGASGRLDADVDLEAGADGPAGAIAIAAREGSATLPQFPLPLPFQSLSGRLALGGDALVRVEELSLSGPGIDARVAGALGPAESLAEAPLELRIELAVDAGLRAALQGLGVPVGTDGRATLQVSGTASRPVVE